MQKFVQQGVFSVPVNQSAAKNLAQFSVKTSSLRWPLPLSFCIAAALTCAMAPGWAQEDVVDEQDTALTQVTLLDEDENSEIESEDAASTDAQRVQLAAVPSMDQAKNSKVDTLPQVMVKAKKESKNTGYQGNKAQVGKTNQLPKDIPQSVTVVSQQLMQDRGAVSLKDALRNVAGLTSSAGEGGRIGDNVNIRGFSAVGDMYLDGVRDSAQYNREVFNLEQVEVLRGSASMLYGRGSTGGVINQVTKKPKMQDSTDVGLSGGSFKFLRGTSDINRVLSEKNNVAFRLNSLYTSTNSFRDDVKQKRWGIAPSIGWGLGTKNEGLLSYYFLSENNVPDYGVPYLNGRPLPVPMNRFYGLADLDHERNKASIATLSYTHHFNKNSEWRTILRQGYYNRDLMATAPRFIGTPTFFTNSTVIRRNMAARGSTENALTAQSEYIGKFRTGPIKHEVLTGYSFMWERAKRWSVVNPTLYPNTTVSNSISTPYFSDQYIDAFTKNQFNKYSGRTNSIYMQDSAELVRHLKLVGGVRFDRLTSRQDRPGTASTLDRTDNMWSYRGGLVYTPHETSSYYVSYGTSVNPSSELYALDDRTANTAPEKNRNMEAGAKWDLLGGDLSLRTAIFRTEKTNERNTNPLLLDAVVLGGRRHTQGVELEAVGRITKNWQIFSGMAIMRSNIDEARFAQAANLNKRPANTPNYMYNVWSTYTFNFLHGTWKIGTGIDGVGMRYGNTTNLTSVPSYRRVDAMIEYARERYAIRLNLYNLLNAKYYDSIGGGHAVPAAMRSGMLTLNVKI